MIYPPFKLFIIFIIIPYTIFYQNLKQAIFQHFSTLPNTFLLILGANNAHTEYFKTDMSKSAQNDRINDESIIGIGFFTSGLIILMIGLLILCIINRVF